MQAEKMKKWLEQWEERGRQEAEACALEEKRDTAIKTLENRGILDRHR